jgi:hypothetical protein
MVRQAARIWCGRRYHGPLERSARSAAACAARSEYAVHGVAVGACTMIQRVRLLRGGIQRGSHSVDLSRPCFRQGSLQMRYELLEELRNARQVNRQQDPGQHAPQDLHHMPWSLSERRARHNLTRRLGLVARSIRRALRGEWRTRSPRAFEAVDAVSASCRSRSRSCTATCWAACPGRSWTCRA